MIKIGTRGSPLALVQAQAVAAPLRALGADVEIVPVRTEGDRRLEVQLAAIGGKGLFVREIEEMLLGGALDCANRTICLKARASVASRSSTCVSAARSSVARASRWATSAAVRASTMLPQQRSPISVS